MRYFVENALENIALIKTISDSFPDADARRLFNCFKRHGTIVLVTGEHPTPQFMFRNVPEAVFISEAELRELVFTLSLEQ